MANFDAEKIDSSKNIFTRLSQNLTQPYEIGILAQLECSRQIELSGF
jgi:hypothetical protein